MGYQGGELKEEDEDEDTERDTDTECLLVSDGIEENIGEGRKIGLGK